MDVFDRKIGKYTTKMKTKRWSANAFTNALDSCRTNASTIFQEGTWKKN